MKAGQIWKDETYTYYDEISGRPVTKLTNYNGHSNNLYFTDDFWVEDNKSFIFASDRENHANLFLYDLPTKTIKQLTAFEGPYQISGVYFKPHRTHYFWYGPGIYTLHLDTLEVRQLYELEEDFKQSGSISVTADGKYACTCIQKVDTNKDIPRLDYVKSPEYYKTYNSKPLTKILRIEIATGKVDVALEELYYITHINTSPSIPNILTFSHEGPWAKIDQRIWGLDINTGKHWKIRQQNGDAAIGHEYWLKDGVHIGYHGRRLPEEKMHFWGIVKWDNTEIHEYDFPVHCTHFASNDIELGVGDGLPGTVQPWFPSPNKPHILLIKREEEGFTGPRTLALHRCTFNYHHPHATITPDGKHVLYTSDVTGYANIYIVEIGDFYELPKTDET